MTRAALIRTAAELAVKYGVTVVVDGEKVIVAPKGESDDEFDLVRMKRK